MAWSVSGAIARSWAALAGGGEALWQAQDSAFADEAAVWALTGAVVSCDAISEVCRVERGGRSYYLKRYRQPGKGLRCWLGRSRVCAEWENLRLFRDWGLPVPELVAYGQRWDGDGYRGAMVTAALPSVQGLDALAERLRDPPWREALLQRLARYVAILHRHGFAHGDLNWRNLLVASQGEPEVYFIDCPGGRIWPWPLRRLKIAKDLWLLDKLARQYLSRSQRLRFYLMYRGIARLDGADKRLLRAIVAKTKQ